MNITKLLLIALVALLVSSRLKAAEEPVYEGKPASYWIKRLADSFVPNEIFGRPSKEGPMQALRSIGPAAVPAMIESLKDQNGYVRVAAAYALGEFHADAKAAVPALVEAIRSGRLGDAATDALQKIGPAARAAIAQLAQGLTDENLTVRINVAYALAKLDSENTAAIECLVEAVSNKAGDRRVAISALGNLGPRAKPAVPVLITVLADPDYYLPTAAAYALRNIGPAAKAAAPSLAEALAKSQNQYFCETAGEALAAIGPEAREAIPTLIAIVRSSDLRLSKEDIQDLARQHEISALVKSGSLLQSPFPRPAAFRALSGIGTQAVPHLVAILDQVPAARRPQVIAAIGQIGPAADGAVPALTAALKDEDMAVRVAAANALGNIGPVANGAAPTLTGALADTAASVRVNAAIALMKIDRKSAVALPVLVDVVKNRSGGRQAERALREPGAQQQASAAPWKEQLAKFGDASVHCAAVRALGEIGPDSKTAIAALVESLADSDRNFVRAAADVLAKLGPEVQHTAVRRLAEALKHEDALVRSAAVWTLAEGIHVDPEPNVVVALIERLGEKNENVRQGATFALAKILREPAAGSVLIETLKSQQTDVRREAAALLGRLGPKAKEAVTPLAELLRDEDPQVRKAAAAALLKIDADAASRVGLHRFQIEDLPPGGARVADVAATVRWGGPKGRKESSTPTTARLLRIENSLNHCGRVNCVAFSPDGKHLASASEDETVVLWSVATERELTIFVGHKQGALCVAFSPDGKTLASGAGDGTVHVWSVETGKPLHALKVAEERGAGAGTGDPASARSVSTVAFSPDGTKLAAGCQGSTAVYAVATGQELFRVSEEEYRTFGPRPIEERWVRWVSGVAWAPDGKTLATGNADGGITLWSAKDARQIRTLAKTRGSWSQGRGSQALAFSRNGRTLAAIVKENCADVVKIWSIETGEVQRVLMPNRSFVGSLAFSADGKSLAASCNGAVLFWSTDTGQTLAAHGTGDNEPIVSVALSPDGKRFAYAYSGISKSVRLRPLGEADYSAQMEFVLGVIMSPDGKTIVTASARAETAGRARGVLRFWSAETSEPLREIVAGEGTIIGSVAFSPDSKVLACTTRDLDTGASNVSRLEVHTGRELRTAAGTAMVLAFSPDGKILVGSGAGPGNPDNTIRLWKADTLEPIRTLPSQQEVIHSLAFSPNGKILASGGSDSTVKVWSIESGQELLTFTGHVPDRGNTAERRLNMPVHQVAFSASGQTVGSACGTQIKLWSAATGQELHDLVSEPPRLGTESRATRLFGGPGSRLTTLSFSSDGKTIVTTSPDRRLTFWALTDGREQSSLELPYEASLLGFSPDGPSLVTWNANGSCYILPAPFARP